MTKKKDVLSSSSKKMIKGSKSFIREIYLSNFHFQKKHDKHKIVVDGILVTINKEMSAKDIEEVLSNDYYKIKALRNYFKSEKRTFNQSEALEKYALVKIDFIKNMGVSFA